MKSRPVATGQGRGSNERSANHVNEEIRKFSGRDGSGSRKVSSASPAVTLPEN